MATAIKQAQGYVRGQLKGGSTGLALTLQFIEHMLEHGDWTPLAWMVGKLEKRDGARIRAIIGSVVGGVTIVTAGKEAKAQPSGVLFKMSDNAGPTKNMETLRSLIEEETSFRSAKVQKELLGKDPAPFDLKAYAKRFAAKMDKEGFSFKDLMSEVQAVKAA